MGLLSAEHVGAVAAVAVVAFALCSAASLRPGRWIDTAARALAVIVFTAEASWWVFLALGGRGPWSAAYDLPLQLCDVAGFIVPAALWWRRPLLVELAYFWGLGGTVQALLTPDLKEHFPTYPYWQFYVAHGGVVVAALFLVIGLHLRPRPGAVPRIFLITLAFTALVALTDVVTGGNYMFLRQPPSSGSLLNFMGPWPWYIATGTVLALVFLVILDAPFRLGGNGRWVAVGGRLAGRRG